MRTHLFVDLANCAISRAQLIGATGPSPLSPLLARDGLSCPPPGHPLARS
jgi:hypothetical protein